MKMKKILFVLILVLISNYTEAFEIKGKIVKKSYRSSVTNGMRDYLLYIPERFKKDEKMPVLLFLHGNGERGNDINNVKVNGPLYEVENGRDFPFIIIAPQLPDFPKGYIQKLNEGNWDWSKRFPMERKQFNAEHRYGELYPPYGWHWIEKDLIYLINEIINNHNGDEKRVYITGLSYGGYGTWYMLSKYPELFAAGIPVCGAGDPNDVKTIGNTPVWLFHGGRDRIILPQWSLKMAEELDKIGGNVRVTIHEDLGHDCWWRVYSGHDVYEWMLKNTKR